MIKMDNDQHGIFNNGNSYIVLHRIRTGSFTQQVLYYWLVSFFFPNIYKSKACVPLLFLLLVMKLWRSRRIF